MLRHQFAATVPSAPIMSIRGYIARNGTGGTGGGFQRGGRGGRRLPMHLPKADRHQLRL